MRRIFTHLLLVVMCMLSMTAKAQYKVQLESAPENAYFSGEKTFDAQEVAAALGVDTTALRTLLESKTAVYLKQGDDRTNAYTGNDTENAFWMNANGKSQGYSDSGTCWYVAMIYVSGYLTETNEKVEPVVRVYTGQMPGVFAKVYTDTDLSCLLYLVNGEKEVTFDVSLKVDAAKSEIISQLDIVTTYNTTLQFTYGSQYEGKTAVIDMPSIHTQLGIDSLTLEENIASLVKGVIVHVDSIDGEAVYSVTDSLAAPVATTDGWFGRYSNYDESTGKSTSISPLSFLRKWSAGCTMYLKEYKLSDGKFSMTYGQYPGTMQLEDKDTVELYIVYGTKAVKLIISSEIVEPSTLISEMTKVGEQNINVSGSTGTAGEYAETNVAFDYDDVIAKLGCTEEDVVIMMFKDDETILNAKDTYDYWQSETGLAQTWSTTPCAKVYPANFKLSSGKYTVLQMYNTYLDITEPVGPFPLKSLLVYGSKYYQINLNFTITPRDTSAHEYVMKSQEYIHKQMVPSNDWLYPTKTQLDVDYISNILGTSDYLLYGEKYSEADGVFWDKGTNCDDGDAKGRGFWYGTNTHMNAQNEAVVTADGWGNNSFGFQLNSSGELSWFQYPGLRSAGDKYSANIYFVNPETFAYIKYVLDVEYVAEETPDAEIAGYDTLLVLIKDSEGTAKLNIESLKQKLDVPEGVTFEELSYYAAKSSTMLKLVSLDETVYFGKSGYTTTSDESEFNACFYISDETHEVEIYVEQMKNDSDMSSCANLVIQYGNRQMWYTVRFTDDPEALAVADVNVSSDVKSIYNITGLKVNSSRKGVCILRMSDGSVRKVVK